MARLKEQVIYEEILVAPREDTEIVVKTGIGRNGEPYVDIRNFWLPDGETDFIPTKKGVRFHAENLEELIRILNDHNEKLYEAESDPGVYS